VADGVANANIGDASGADVESVALAAEDVDGNEVSELT
jgi:hypothetical protein